MIYVIRFRDEVDINVAQKVDKTMEETSQILQAQLMYCERIEAKFNSHGNIGFAKANVRNTYSFWVFREWFSSWMHYLSHS